MTIEIEYLWLSWWCISIPAFINLLELARLELLDELANRFTPEAIGLTVAVWLKDRVWLGIKTVKDVSWWCLWFFFCHCQVFLLLSD